MRTAVLIGKKRDGTYITLAHPDTPIGEQKLFLKQLKIENGRGVMVGNDFEEAILFDSSSGKQVKFKTPVKTVRADFIPSLDKLADALGISREELDGLRKRDNFPIKEKEGYDVEAVRALMIAG
jgi:hypothetical protein